VVANNQIAILKQRLDLEYKGAPGYEAEAAALSAAIEALEKLPATADGVRVVPDNRIWRIFADGGIWECVVTTIGNAPDLTYEVLDTQAFDACAPDTCYSTRAAAESALSSTTSKGGGE